MHSQRSARLLALLLALAASAFTGVLVGAALGEPELRTVTVPRAQLPGSPPAAQRAGPAPGEADAHAGERSEAGGSERSRNLSQDAAARTTRGPAVLPETLTLASPFQRGCRTRIVRNQSSRNGGRPALFVLHYTVSPNRPGRSDVDGITAYFNNPGSQASSNYVIDNEGNCNLIVPESAKAWTQGYMNPWSISVEVINTGSESSYAGTAGLAKLGLVVSDATRRWGIPLRRGRTSGCTIVRSGVVDHDSLGCGNNHTDIRPYSVDAVITASRAARAGAGYAIPRAERRIAHRLCYHRRHGQRYLPHWQRLARARLRLLRRLARRAGSWRPRHRGGRYQRIGGRLAGRC
jgi:hypothetical protein